MRITNNHAGLNRIALKLAVVLSLTQLAAAPKAAEPSVSSRSLVIVVDADAPPKVKAAAEAIRSAAQQQPLLKLMTGDREPELIDSDALLNGKIPQRAFNNLIVVGLPQSKLISEVQQHEAMFDQNEISVFGFGHFKGDLGYIESERNPFLHSDEVARAPYETELVTLTGTTADGVAMAVDAFLHRGIINGVIGRENGWTRPSPSLLDRPPLTPDVRLPQAPAELGKSSLIGVTQASGDEYRNVLADAGVEPKEIWRFKYYVKGAWDGEGAASAIAEYNAGLHRRAFADTLWVGTFDSEDSAQAAAAKIASAADLSKKTGSWTGDSKAAPGTPAELWVKGSSVYMTDLKR